MSDPLDPIFVDPVEKHATKEEKAELKKLNDIAEKLYEETMELTNERIRLLKELPTPNMSEKQKRKDGKDMLLRVNTMRVQELREERKKINASYNEDVKHLGDERRIAIKENPALKENQIKKDEIGDNNSEAWRKYRNLREKLHKKYTKGEQK